MYEDGQGVIQNDVKAGEWYLKAAEQGHVRAQYFLGLMHYEGRGVAQNEAKALDWLTKAANNGSMDAKESLIKIKSK